MEVISWSNELTLVPDDYGAVPVVIEASGVVTDDVPTIGGLAELLTFFPAQEVEVALPLEAQLNVCLLLYDGAHAFLGLNHAGMFGLSPRGLHVWDSGAFTHLVERRVDFFAWSLVLVPSFSVHEVELGKTDQREGVVAALGRIAGGIVLTGDVGVERFFHPVAREVLWDVLLDRVGIGTETFSFVGFDEQVIICRPFVLLLRSALEIGAVGGDVGMLGIDSFVGVTFQGLFIIISGKLERLSAHLRMVLMCALLAAELTVTGLAQSPFLIIMGMVFANVSYGIMMPTMRELVTRYVPEHLRNTAHSLSDLIFGSLSAIISLIYSSALIHSFGMKSIVAVGLFIIAVPMLLTLKKDSFR